MIIHKVEVGELATNCYVVICSQTKKSFIIDPGGDLDKIKRLSKDTYPIFIMNTHGHIDHIKENQELKKQYGLKVLIHKDDAFMLEDANLNLSSYIWGKNVILSPADKLIEGGDILEVGKLKVQVYHTPGHSFGGVCFLVENQNGDKALFTGDTLFASSIGRTDLYGGSFSCLIKSIKEKILVFEDNLTIYPGHGPTTKVGIEKANNPYVK
ncbi:MAG: MBL fold metallo-hydrolase [bacterium]|nr:MBL fold metallo-hydrolase [bacterium]